ncbi:MAG: NTP transferase domain-containing protein [Saprospiraceae bacterium]
MNYKIANSNIIGVLLAAGQAKRMGEAKQLLDIQGEPLIVHTLKKLLTIQPDFPVLTILGARAGSINPVLIDLPTTILMNPDYKKGMGTSLTTALKYLDEQQLSPSAILLSVCDQPYLTTKLFAQLIEKHQQFPNKIIVARYHNSFGVPALLPRQFFAELRQLQADKGAKKVMVKHRSELVFIDFPQGDIDLDTPEDYQKFISTSSL